MSERIYRDSVHNIIRVELGSPLGDLIARLVDTAEFQRLRRIRQLGLAHFAYQAAEHSRFTHSLGAFHLATRTLGRLSGKYEISAGDQAAVRVAALLHDIGHGPYSHVIEGIFGFHHEDFTIEAILSRDTEVGRTIFEFSPQLATDAADIIRGTFKPMALAQLVSSQLDVDRMDYLLRDSLMTGAKYGIYDLEWIIKSLEINEDEDQLYVSAHGVSSVEDYLQARYYMFRQVYFHRTLRAAECVLRSTLQRALKVYRQGGDVWHIPGSSFEKILRGESLQLREHLALDDTDVLFHIKHWHTSSDAVLADLAGRFLHRRLFKAFDLDMPDEEKGRFLKQASAAVADNGYDPEYYFIEDKAGDVPHYFYTRKTASPKDLIYVEHGYSSPQIREISEISSAVRGLQEGYRLHRVCFPAEVSDLIRQFYLR